MPGDKFPEFLYVSFLFHQRQLNHSHVAVVIEITRFIQYISYTAAHSCSEVASRGAEYNHSSAGHVFAAMIANAFHNGCCTAVSYGKSFTCNSRDVGFASCCAVKHSISDYDVLVGFKGGSGRRNDYYTSS